jgi:hypothetical protein
LATSYNTKIVALHENSTSKILFFPSWFAIVNYSVEAVPVFPSYFVDGSFIRVFRVIKMG